MRVKSPPMDEVHNDIWWSCCKPQFFARFPDRKSWLCNCMPTPLQSLHPNQTIFYLGSSLPPLVGPVAPKLFALVCFFTTQFPNSGLDTETQDHPVPRFQKLTHRSVHLKMNKYCVKMIILQCVWYISCSIGGNLLWHFYHLSDKMESLCLKFSKYFASVNVRIFFKAFLLNKKIMTRSAIIWEPLIIIFYWSLGSL